MKKPEQEILIGVIIFSVIFVIALVLFFFYLYKYKSKNQKYQNQEIGQQFEKQVNSFFQNWCLDNNSKYIKSSLFKYKKDYLFEVDGILIMPRSLIVIECKSINGKISGDATSKKWIKQIGPNQHEINNPVEQNEKHISHILNIIKTRVPILSMIIFDAERTESVNIDNKPSHVLIIKSDEIKQTLEQIDMALLPKLNNNEIYQILNSLEEHKTSSKFDIKTFKSFFKENKNDQQRQ